MASARYGYMTASPSDRSSGNRVKENPVSTSNGNTGLKRPRSPLDETSSSAAPLFESTPIHDRKSTFTGYFSPTLPPHDLQSLPAFTSASHKVLAYRVPASAPLSSTKKSRQSTLSYGSGEASKALQIGQDDDGEQYAAKHVAKVLADLNVVGSLVVARWYGGVMLGPVRFKHIEDVAREAVKVYLSSLGRGKSAAGTGAEDRSGHVIMDEAPVETPSAEKARLTKELDERDQSILSLRQLLEQKKALLGTMEGTSSQLVAKDQASPGRKIDYSAMDLMKLRALDQARDKTVAFLLKQIDAVEEKIVACNELEQDDGPEPTSTDA